MWHCRLGERVTSMRMHATSSDNALLQAPYVASRTRKGHTGQLLMVLGFPGCSRTACSCVQCSTRSGSRAGLSYVHPLV